MRIGLTGAGSTMDKLLRQAQQAEADGFSALWYPSMVLGDPLAPMAVIGRATERIELGTSVVQTYPCHPLLQANRASAAAAAMGRAGFTLGLGPSHAPAIEGAFGLDYDRAGTNTEEYVRIVTAALAGEAVDFSGEAWSARGSVAAPQPVGLVLAALAPRMLRLAGQVADGTILWMANARAVESHVVPRITASARDAGRPAPRVIAGLPVVVHDDEAEARSKAAGTFAVYGTLPNYQRILAHGGVSGPADAAIVGNEASVAAQLQGLFDAGATDIWAAPFPVGEDRDQRAASSARTMELLRSLVR